VVSRSSGFTFQSSIFETRLTRRRARWCFLRCTESLRQPPLQAADRADLLGDETLRSIAREFVQAVRYNVKIDWTVREDVRAKLRVLVKRILRKHGYPPDKQEKATQTVLEQAEAISSAWVTGQ